MSLTTTTRRPAGVRVLHVITRLSLGGASENTIASIAALETAGYRCTLATGVRASDPVTLGAARRRGCRLLDVPTLGRDVAPVRDVAALVSLVRCLRRERPGIVHTHTSKAGFLGRLAARLARVPAVIHQPHGHVFYGYGAPRRAAVYERLERRAARWCDRIVTLTDRGTEEHLARGIGTPDQYVTVPSGVPTSALRARAPGRHAARAALGLDDGDFLVAAVGRLEPVKGFDVLVRALPDAVSAGPRIRVLLVGDGPERAALERSAGELGVADRVRVTGVVDDVVPYLAAADLLAAPSRNEGMGRAIVEAMALGLPVVAAAVGGIPSVVAVGETGWLVGADAPAALAAALVDLAGDAALCRKYGEAGIRRAERFSSPVAEARLREAYTGLVRAKRLERAV